MVRSGIGQDPEDLGDDGAERPLEDGVGERGLGAEVVVHQGFVDPGLGGDLLGPAAGGALPEEDGVGGVEDPLAGFLVGPGLRVGGGFDRLVEPLGLTMRLI